MSRYRLREKIRAFRAFLPYCIKRLEDGSFVLLNRAYLPIGFFTKEWIDYKAYPIRYKSRLGWHQLIERIDAKLVGDCAFLYNDATCPFPLHGSYKVFEDRWASYTKKLRRLAALSFEEPLNT